MKNEFDYQRKRKENLECSYKIAFYSLLIVIFSLSMLSILSLLNLLQ